MQGKDASSAGMRRARGAASALLARRDRAARQPRGGPIGYSGRSCRWCPPADVCAHTVAHRSWCLTPGRSALPTKIRTPVTGVFRSSGADACMLPRIPLSEGPTGACQPTVSRAWTTLPQCPQTSGRGGSRAHSAQTTRRARTKLGTVRSDAMTDLAHARRHGHAPPYGAQCPKWGPVPTGMAPWYKVF